MVPSSPDRSKLGLALPGPRPRAAVGVPREKLSQEPGLIIGVSLCNGYGIVMITKLAGEDVMFLIFRTEFIF